MNNQKSLLRHLEACTQEDLCAQTRIRELLAQQSAALTTRNTESIEETTDELDRELDAGLHRVTRRGQLIDGFASIWGIPGSALSLSSIAERYGPGSEKLMELRTQLRTATTEVMEAGRRNAALIRMHREVVHEVMDVLFGEGGKNPLDVEGSLVNAEA